MTEREAMKLALEALEFAAAQIYNEDNDDIIADAITALRQALEQPEQVSVPDGWKLVPTEPTDAMLSVPVNIDLRECVTPGGVTGLDAVGLFRAWEAMIEAAPQPWNTTDMAHRAGGLSMEQEPVACKHNRYSVDVHEQTGTCYDCGAEGRMRFVIDDTSPPKQPECNPHPDAPHGFNRESSHSLGRYVCDCEGWEPEQKPVAWWNPRYGKGEYAFAEEQSPPDDSNDPSDFGWNIPLYTAPLKPAQDLIVGYADSHDIARDGHDFWVSRQPGKNTVPLYLYGHPPKIWQGLTGDEVNDLKHWLDHRAQWSYIEFARAIEAKLRAKNGG